MSAKIVGIERLDYTSKKTNNRVQGYKLHLTEKLTKQGAVGEEAYSAFLPDEKAPGLAGKDLTTYVGRVVTILYNKYGSADGFDFVEQGK